MTVCSVQSTTLAAVAYDNVAHLLRLQFRRGDVYCYSGVPAEVHHGLLEAESAGAYFNRHIRGRFPYRRETENNLNSLRLTERP